MAGAMGSIGVVGFDTSVFGVGGFWAAFCISFFTAAFGVDGFTATVSVGGAGAVLVATGSVASGGGASMSHTVPPAANATKTNRSIAGKRTPLRVGSRGSWFNTTLPVFPMLSDAHRTVWDQLLIRTL